MRKISQSFVSMILVAVLLIPGISTFAATKQSSGVADEQQVQVNTLQDGITTLDNSLKQKNTNVISELNKQIGKYQTKLKETTDSKEYGKIQRLITTVESLVRDYSNYTEKQSYKDSNNEITRSSNMTYEAAVAAVIAYFDANGYELASELLTHARDNDVKWSTYEPTYGGLCAESSVINNIYTHGGLSGSAAFPKTYFGKTVDNDLYYAIHLFNWVKNIEDGYLEITDKYDYADGDHYTGASGVAISMMYKAQNAGYIKPYNVKIDIYR